MLPHYGEEGVDASGYQSPASMSQTLPIRLVDYFVSANHARRACCKVLSSMVPLGSVRARCDRVRQEEIVVVRVHDPERPLILSQCLSCLGVHLSLFGRCSSV